MIFFSVRKTTKAAFDAQTNSNLGFHLGKATHLSQIWECEKVLEKQQQSSLPLFDVLHVYLLSFCFRLDINGSTFSQRIVFLWLITPGMIPEDEKKP